MEPALMSLSSIIGQVGLIGMASLIALHLADRHVGEDELRAVVHIDSESTLRKALRTCEIHQLATSLQRVKRGQIFWHITDLGRSFLQAISLIGLPGASTGDCHLAATADSIRLAAPGDDVTKEKKFFFGASSSSDRSDQSSNQDLIDHEEEESEFKKFLCQQFNLSGAKAQAVIADDRITPEILCGWMAHVYTLKREKFRFRASPEGYALGCLLKPGGPDEPPHEAMHTAGQTVYMYRRQFEQLHAYDDEDDDEEDEKDQP